MNRSTIYFIGQFIVAMVGVPYSGYVLNAGSHAQQAESTTEQIDHRPMLLSIHEIAPETFSNFKRTTLRPQVLSICLQQVTEQLVAAENSTVSARSFCDCYVEKVTEAITQDDMAYLEQNKEPSAELETRMETVRQSARQQCRS
jgi:hypothetical protein